MLYGKRILLIISGGIAAYKSLDLIRRLRERGATVRCVLTRAGAEFVTPLSVAALSGDRVYGDLFSLTDEHEMGHIRLARETDLVVVAPASADFLGKMSHGLADDLASTLLLVTEKPVLVAPSMNASMWRHPAVRETMARLTARGVMVAPPASGSLACGEEGEGRMAEAAEIADAIEAFFTSAAPLAGRRALVTSGPTHEPLDPVRYLGNRSSGRQGHAISLALARLGAETILVSGPTAEPDPPGVTLVQVETARQMLAACQEALPAEIAVCAAAVADWRPVETAATKLKKKAAKESAPILALTETPDILATLAAPGNRRPALVVGFAAETEPQANTLIASARDKRQEKGCDWIVANDVSPGTGVFGGEESHVFLITGETVEDWGRAPKTTTAERLAARIADHFAAG